jgi:D-galacturonate reductase
VLKKRRVHTHVELHKRFDPLYADALTKSASATDFGHLTHFHGYMSQPRSQLQTFAAWAGRSSDISYYLNSHHVDVLLGMALPQGLLPTTVAAVGARGVASRELPSAPSTIEDAITLTICLRDEATGRAASGVLTSCWTAPRSDVHSQQRFFAVGSAGQIEIDQARRGYSHATDERGYTSVNPLFMKYSAAPDGSFDGALGYGYRSIAHFVRASAWGATEDVSRLAPLDSPAVEWATAILQAGRISLDAGGARVTLGRGSQGRITLTLDTPAPDSTSAKRARSS